MTELSYLNQVHISVVNTHFEASRMRFGQFTSGADLSQSKSGAESGQLMSRERERELD